MDIKTVQFYYKNINNLITEMSASRSLSLSKWKLLFD